jgi:hypothetical protein
VEDVDRASGGLRQYHVLVERAAGEPAENDGGEGLCRGRFVHHATALPVEVGLQAGGRGGQGTPVEVEGGEPAGDQVPGMHVPALVVTALERPGDEPVVPGQCGADVVVAALRDDLGGAVADPHSGLGRRYQHHGLRVVGDRMLERLEARRDAAGRAVVVSAVVQSGAPPVGEMNCLGDGDGAVRADDRLGTLDLQFEVQ